MATWDGSCPAEVKDQYCYMFPVDSVATSAARNFAGNSTFLQDIPARNYPAGANGQHVYEQSRADGTATTFYQIGANILPVPSNMVPLGNVYQEHILPNATSVNDTQVPNSLQHSSNSVRPIRSTPHASNRGSYNPRSKTNGSCNNYAPMSEGDSIRSSIVKNSNLHPMANEFIPNGMKYKKDKFKKDAHNDVAGSNFNAQDFKSKSAMTSASLSDNKYNKGDKRYNNWRNINHKQKSLQDTQAPNKSNYKDTRRTYNARNYNKSCPTYYSKKHGIGAFSVEQHAMEKAYSPMTEPTDSFASSSQENRPGDQIQKDDCSSSVKVSMNKNGTSMREDNGSDDYSLSKVDVSRNDKAKQINNHMNAPTYNHKYNPNGTQFELPIARNIRRYTGSTRSERYENNYRGRKSNFNIQNSPRGSTYSKNNGNEKLDDNNEAAVHRKEKKVENWRDRTDNNEPVTRPRKKNLQKKNEIGMIILFIINWFYYTV